MTNTTSFIRIYQDGECTKTIRGNAGDIAIKGFWNNHNPSSVIRRAYPKTINFYNQNGSIKAQQNMIMFPKLAGHSKLVHHQTQYTYIADGMNTEVNLCYYNGIAYLVEVRQINNHYGIKNIYIANYVEGAVTSIAHMIPMKPTWFIGKLGFIDIKPDEESIYKCFVYTTNCSTQVNLKTVRYETTKKEK